MPEDKCLGVPLEHIEKRSFCSIPICKEYWQQYESKIKYEVTFDHPNAHITDHLETFKAINLALFSTYKPIHLMLKLVSSSKGFNDKPGKFISLLVQP